MDAESFKQQFLPLHPKLYRIAFALTENSRDAEDILQETYFKLWSKREELAGICNPEAFCVTLIKNLSLDYLRTSRRHEAVDEMMIKVDISPETALIERDDLDQVQRLMKQLPEQQRQVLHLHTIENCSLEEIEEITGLGAVNVRVLLSRARKFIREQYIQLVSYERKRI
ncbi:DNA-directed RNA polymerase sigma-70 factor [Bacteroidia bacterium]|nr:DNA-directed RNA polymerase sigma-70 factor [Bacteroidia bacterium]